MDFTALYDDDIETWAERQVEALRSLAATSGPWTNAVDWENVIEEIEDVGRSRRSAVESLLENAFVHVLKIAADPKSLSAEHWRKEADEFWAQAQEKANSSMRSRVDMDKIWRRASERASNSLEAFDRSLPDVPRSCPYSFDDVLDRDFGPKFDLRTILLQSNGHP